MVKIGIFYGSTMGNTANAAEKIREELVDAEVINVEEASGNDLAKYDYLVFGASTWGDGDLQDDWERFIDSFDTVDLTGKKVALFGLGDQDGYPDTFIDAVGTIYNKVRERGAEVVGSWSTDGYSYSASTAVSGDEFVGLALDEDNQSDMTDLRIRTWVRELKEQFV